MPVEGQRIPRPGLSHDQEAHLINETELTGARDESLHGPPVESLIDPTKAKVAERLEEITGRLPPAAAVKEGHAFQNHVVMDDQFLSGVKRGLQAPGGLRVVDVVAIRRGVDGGRIDEDYQRPSPNTSSCRSETLSGWPEAKAPTHGKSLSVSRLLRRAPNFSSSTSRIVAASDCRRSNARRRRASYIPSSI